MSTGKKHVRAADWVDISQLDLIKRSGMGKQQPTIAFVYVKTPVRGHYFNKFEHAT